MKSLVAFKYNVSTPQTPSLPQQPKNSESYKSFKYSVHLKVKIKHIFVKIMLCCTRKKESRPNTRIIGEGAMGYPQYQYYQQAPVTQQFRKTVHFPHYPDERHKIPEMVIQSDFRKVSGITSEIFRQIEAVERDYDPSISYEAVEKRGEMLIRLLDPRTLGRAGADAGRTYLSSAANGTSVQFVEIIKRPGQTLGLYIREGDGFRAFDGVFISRIALESPVYNSGLLKVGDEILAVNLVDVRRMSLDDVVIIMSIPRRLVLTIRSHHHRIAVERRNYEEYRQPVVVVKKDLVEEESFTADDLSSQRDSENGFLLQARLKGIEPACLNSDRDYFHEDPYYDRLRLPQEETWISSNYRRFYGIIGNQPLPRYPRTIDNFIGPIYSQNEGFNDFRNSTVSTSRMINRSPGRWNDTGLRRNRLLRAESDNRIYPTNSDQYKARSFRSSTPTSYKVGAPKKDLRSFSTQGISSILRSRSVTDGSVSDTEFGGASRPSCHFRRPLNYQRDISTSSYARSNSLPRSRGSSILDYRYKSPQSLKRVTRGQVRFERDGYSSLYDDDSDGALSAPELPEARVKRMINRRNIGSRSQREYQWLTRAPSTSAIYESLRRPLRPPVMPRGLSSSNLNKIAHSAESLLDTIRTEQQKSILENIYAHRPTIGRPSVIPSNRDLSNDSLSFLNHLRNRPALDYLRTIPNPTPVKPSEQERLHLLTLNPREFFKYRYEKTSEALKQGFSGLLWVHLLAGRGLRSGTTPTHRDLYCVIETDRTHKARTVIRSGESSFDWDEIFEIDIMEAKEVSFLLYSWDPQYRHKLCYKGIINLLSLSLAETPVHALALKMEPKGTLYIKMRYKDINASFQRCPSSSPLSPNAIFGISLETLVNRENSGSNVPLILKRCIEEVEKRGLDLVGIYRLCGSAVRKKILREAFEKNAWMVDLTAEHVPDINVITNLIKDFIRELPKPLFTKALFDMMVDGLSVCLPDDAAGNAKLMFSVLECLPKINRCTVLHLMDHLKLVVSHSDRNKMCAQAIAVSFGPLFTCHSGSESFQKPVEVFKLLLEIWPVKKGSTWSTSNETTLESQVSEKPLICLQRMSKTSSPTVSTPSVTKESLEIATLTPGPSPSGQSLTTESYPEPTHPKMYKNKNYGLSKEESKEDKLNFETTREHFIQASLAQSQSASHPPKKSVAWAAGTHSNNGPHSNPPTQHSANNKFHISNPDDSTNKNGNSNNNNNNKNNFDSIC